MPLCSKINATVPREVRSDHFISRRSNTFTRIVCDRKTDGGGWLVIQRQLPNGHVSFYRGWGNYENGFGDLDGEFWYGLKKIHTLTKENDVELRIDMTTNANFRFHWTYQTFRVAGASDKYRLTIGGGVGSTGTDAMAVHNNQQFSTFDNDNDATYGTNCAQDYQGGWWYNQCFETSLTSDAYFMWNGVGSQRIAQGIYTFQLKKAEMKIRIKT